MNYDQSLFLKITPYEQPYTDARPIKDYDDQVDFSKENFNLDSFSEEGEESPF